MKRNVLGLFLSSIFLLCSSCSIVGSPSQQPVINTPGGQVRESDSLSFSLSEIPFYEILDLSPPEQVSILDVSDHQLLLNIFTDYTPDDPQFKEEGYSSVTKELVIYDIEDGRVMSSYRMPDEVFCTDASFLGTNVFVYVTVSTTKNDSEKYSIEVSHDASTTTVTSGMCDGMGYDAPEVEALGDSYFAYSYCNFETNAFGVNISTIQGGITPQISLVDDGSTQHLRTTLRGNGSEYIYYTAVESKGTIFIGNSAKQTHQFELPSTERVYEYCFLENQILFTMEKQEEDSVSKAMIVTDFEGNHLLEHRCDELYRLKSNGKDTVLGIDGTYAAYVVHVADDEILMQRIDTQKAPVRFYCLNDRTFLLHYYRNEDGLSSLLRLTIEEL